jgi:predicted  nucleic acid-binding Zn-ribbon protein
VSQKKAVSVSEDYRAILTDKEQEIIAGDADVSDGYYYRVVTRVRKKIERLESDLELLDEHHDSLGDELREAVDAVDDAMAEADETADE